jgi:hypothetical protein
MDAKADRWNNDGSAEKHEDDSSVAHSSVAGLSPDCQLRLLGFRPFIVVATLPPRRHAHAE